MSPGLDREWRSLRQNLTDFDDDTWEPILDALEASGAASRTLVANLWLSAEEFTSAMEVERMDLRPLDGQVVQALQALWQVCDKYSTRKAESRSRRLHPAPMPAPSMAVAKKRVGPPIRDADPRCRSGVPIRGAIADPGCRSGGAGADPGCRSEVPIRGADPGCRCRSGVPIQGAGADPGCRSVGAAADPGAFPNCRS